MTHFVFDKENRSYQSGTDVEGSVTILLAGVGMLLLLLLTALGTVALEESSRQAAGLPSSAISEPAPPGEVDIGLAPPSRPMSD